MLHSAARCRPWPWTPGGCHSSSNPNHANRCCNALRLTQTGYSGVDGIEALSFEWQRDQWVLTAVTDPSIPMGAGHNGGIDGFMSSAAHFPEPDISYALTLKGANYSFNEILTGFATILSGAEYEMPDVSLPTAITLTPAQMQAYTGHYVSPDAPIDLRLAFEPMVDGRFQRFTFSQRAMRFEFSRVSPPGD